MANVVDGDTASQSGRSSVAGTSSSNGDLPGDHGIIPIVAHGDMVLQIEHETRSADETKSTKHLAKFRVSTVALKQHSRYFERLLQAGRFGEGSDVHEQHKRLREQYQSLNEAPSAELPIVVVQDVGRISTVKSITALCTDFLHILHGKDTQTFPPVANLANLAIVADRFDALDAVKSYVKRKKMIRAIDGKTTPKADTTLSEEKVRQRLLVGLMLDYPTWVEKYSARLITKGWVGRELDTTAAMWWDMPHRIEEELLFRRECILETIQSLQSFFLTLYTSRGRQCRLGYDSSAQCDSFQLGEMVRFFTRVGTLQLQGAFFDSAEPPAPFEGDIYVLLDTLRQIPEYQIDRNHTHCGIRTRLVPLLDLLQECLPSVGVCSECWADDRAGYAWVETKRPLLWRKQVFRLRAQGHGNRHADLRAMFMAVERDWWS